ncbi:cytochrome P450 [Pseudalkalibacillus hwajinpoensis]|uniref:Cytochrome P450 n=1 Tax=Guptibacillus hwajinpoensis TaxID=208199 RepID=A0A4U1MN17_9BACL|nr:cytochrome P450 [Pseudalkalibacillus hwajinpoensis]TKD72106.1 cytochrome P450 [Pseudalkalibacillus hwajinpoensis]
MKVQSKVSSKSRLRGQLKEFRQDPLHFLMSNSELQGDVAHFRFGPQKVYLLTNPATVKQIMLNKEYAFAKSKNFRQLEPFVGKGLLTSEGELHRKQRQLIQPLFRADEVQRYGEEMVSLTDTYCRSFKDGETRLITRDMMNITLAVISKTMFSMELFETHETVGKPIDLALEIVTKRIRSLLKIPLSIPTKDNKQFNHSVQTLDRVIYHMINSRRNIASNDLLSVLMKATNEDGTMSDQQLRDECMTIFLAGHETTANALSWSFYLLAKHPLKRKKMLEELETVLGNRLPCSKDVELLPYTTNVIREALRLYPPAWLFGRDVTKAATLDALTLRKGDRLLISPYVMHRNAEYFTSPHLFKPERFEEGFLKKIPSYTYIPFGGGARVCIGNHFAMMEAVLLIATISQKFTFDLLEEQSSIEPYPLITLRPRNGLLMRVKDRTKK